MSKTTDKLIAEVAHDIDAAYFERNQLLALLTKVFEAHLCVHEGGDSDYENVVCIHLPTGQAMWHIHYRDLPLFDDLVWDVNHWDGHSTQEKYRRIRMIKAHGLHRSFNKNELTKLIGTQS